MEQKEAVLFELFVDTSLDTTSYAYIGLESVNIDELELLFNINTIFRIKKVEYDDSKKNNGLFGVHFVRKMKSNHFI